MIDFLRGAYVLSRSIGRWPRHWCGCMKERHGVRFWKEDISMCVWCWRLKKRVRCGVTDATDLVSGVCIVSTWVAGELFMGMAGAM